MVLVTVDINKVLTVSATLRKRVTAVSSIVSSKATGNIDPAWLTINEIDGGDLALDDSQFSSVNGVLNGGNL